MQALTIATWGANVNVKIPVTNRAGVFMGPLIRRLAEAGVALNVTAILTLEQVEQVVEALTPETWAIVSVFAGRIADTGIDPVPLMAEAKRILRWRPRAQLLWASPRELLNVFQAEEAGCDIITVRAGNPAQDESGGKGSGGVFAGDGGDVSPRCAMAAYQIDTSLVVAAAGNRGGSVSRAAEDDLGGLGEIAREVVGAGVGNLEGGPRRDSGGAMRMVRTPAAWPHCVSVGWSPIIQHREG